MTTLLLVRHGETDWNLDRRVQGHTDRPLNDTGRAQARALAEELRDVTLDAVYSSDLSRAEETARILAGRLGLPVGTVPELREKSFGTWEGLTDSEVLARFPEARRGQWGDGETTEELDERVLAALRRIARDHRGGTVLVVAHGGPMRSVLRHCEIERDGPISNCHLLRIAVEDGRLRATD